MHDEDGEILNTTRRPDRETTIVPESHRRLHTFEFCTYYPYLARLIPLPTGNPGQNPENPSLAETLMRPASPSDIKPHVCRYAGIFFDPSAVVPSCLPAQRNFGAPVVRPKLRYATYRGRCRDGASLQPLFRRLALYQIALPAALFSLGRGCPPGNFSTRTERTAK